MTTTIGLYIFDGVEALDFAGPFEVFTTAARMHARTHAGDAPLMQVQTIGRSRARVRARAGLELEPQASLHDHAKLDVLVIPGGVVDDELARPDVLDWIATQATQATQVPLVASVCTGAFLLAAAGLLDGREATTHWEDLDDFRKAFPRVRVVGDVRWVDEGRVVTSAGISAGIDMSLHLVQRLHGRALAERTARQMDVDWQQVHR
jgi:transcriptional regulator GlxA family with amidase domain